jgi:CrcB protein
MRKSSGTEFYVWLGVGISASSIAGVATRIALTNTAQAADFFPNSSQISVNMLGSFVIGLLFGIPNLVSHMPLVYHSLAAGFCGSLTTFSSWIYAIMKPGSDWSAELITGLTVPFISLLFGKDLASFTLKSLSQSEGPKDWQHRLDSYFVIFFAAAVVAVMVTLGVTRAVESAYLIECALGPLGALTRAVLAFTMNGKVLAHFMIGTFVANVIAVLIVGALSSCRDENEWCEYSIVGIAGSLSTVSSWALDTVKIYSKTRRWAYCYCILSVGCSVALMAPFR